MPPKTYTAEHEWTVAWMIELWLRIYGGDPAPDEIDKLSADLLVNAAMYNIASKLPAGQNGREIQDVSLRNIEGVVKQLHGV